MIYQWSITTTHKVRRFVSQFFLLKAKHKGESWQSSLLERLKQQLENKRMIYLKDQLELTTTVGQGKFYITDFEHKQDILQNNISGESGLVYKGYIKTSVGKQLVAIKTGKGRNILGYVLLYTLIF